jgi:L-fuconolactonase
MSKSDTGMTRRDFLAGTAAAVAVTRLEAADQPKLDGYVDAHSHIWTDDVRKYPLVNDQPASKLIPRTFTADELLAIARPLGVSRVVLIQHRPYFGVDNRYLADMMAAHPGVFSGVACIAAEEASPDREMVRLKGLGFLGFRITPGEGGADRWANSAGINSMWRIAPQEGLAICPLIGPDNIFQVDEMCRKYPETTVVVDHFARVGQHGDFPEEDVQRLVGLAKHPKVHVKVSAFYFLGQKKPPYRDLVPLIRRVTLGENNYPASLDLIQKGLDFLADGDRKAILKETAAKVFFN